MINGTSDKLKTLESYSNGSLLSIFGSLGFASFLKPLGNKASKSEKISYKTSKSFLNKSIEVTKESYRSSLSDQLETSATVKIYTPGNYIIIFYSKLNTTNEVKTLNKFYEITYKELCNSVPFVVNLDNDFFKEGQRLLYQKFGRETKGFAKDFSKISVARIYNNQFSTVEAKYPTTLA